MYDIHTTLATELWKRAHEYVSTYRAQGGDAVPEPYRAFIAAQLGPTRGDGCRFQMPESLAGWPADPRVVVIDLNPGLDPNDINPRLDCPLDAHIDWYRYRFGTLNRDDEGRVTSLTRRDRALSRRVIRHDRAVEDLFGHGAFRRHVRYGDTIPWKGTAPPRLDEHGIRFAQERIRSIAEAIQPQFVVTSGNDAGSFHGYAPNRPPLRELGAVGTWKGTILPLPHPNARQNGVGSKTAAIAAAHAVIASLLADTSPRSCSDV